MSRLLQSLDVKMSGLIIFHNMLLTWRDYHFSIKTSMKGTFISTIIMLNKNWGRRNRLCIKCILCVLIYQIHIHHEYVLSMTRNKMMKGKKHAQPTYNLLGRLTSEHEIARQFTSNHDGQIIGCRPLTQK